MALLGQEPMAPGLQNGILAHGQGGMKYKGAGQGQPGLVNLVDDLLDF